MNMDDNIKAFFKNMPVFRNAPAKELARLGSRAKRCEFRKSDFIFQEGDPAEAAWWVAKGIVKISKLTPDGRMTTMEMLTVGDIFAPSGIMNAPRYPANAIAVTPASIVKILRADMVAFVRAYPAVVQDVLEQVRLRVQRSHRLRALDSSSSAKKVAAVLLWLSEKTGDSVGITRREISEIAGMAPETAVRVILMMKRRQWVSATARSVTVSNAGALRSFLDKG